MSEQQYIETLGAEFSAPDIRDYRIDGSSLLTEFPETFELEMPPAKNQWTVGSCVAQSLALIAEYYNKIQHGIDNEISVGYIYGNRVPPLNTTPGMVLRYAVETFCKEGAPFWSEFPIHMEVPDIIQAVEKEKPNLAQSALQSRPTAYLKVATDQEIKTALMKGIPIVFAVTWYKNTKVRDGIIQCDFKEASGGHAMVLYGWDENGWKIQNSWGDYWGKEGRAILPYDYSIREAYIIFDTDTTPINIKKPFKTKNKILNKAVRICNNIFSIFYSLYYKFTN